MKSIEQIADSLGITKAAIYKRFASYGLSVNQLNGEKNGRTKVYGDNIEQLIRAMFQPAAKVETSVETNTDELNAKIADLQALCDGLRVELTAAKEGKEAAEARMQRAETQNDLLLMQIDKLTDTIRAAEAIQAAQVAQLQAAEGQQRQRWQPFKRLKSMFTKGENVE